jgi:hypothetical protein
VTFQLLAAIEPATLRDVGQTTLWSFGSFSSELESLRKIGLPRKGRPVFPVRSSPHCGRLGEEHYIEVGILDCANGCRQPVLAGHWSNNRDRYSRLLRN